MNFEHLRIRGDDRILEVELDHGKANEMGSAQVAEWDQLAALVESDPYVGAVVTWSRKRTSKGTPIFVAGANVAERTDWEPDRVKAHVRRQRDVMLRLQRMPALHVAVVHGMALGWGTEFLLCADYRIAVPGAQFGLPETGLGILPGASGTATLWRHVGLAQALRLGMTGELIGPEEALRIGLVQEVATDLDAAMARARALARAVAKNAPTAVAAFKTAVLSGIGSPDPVGVEAAAYEHCVDTGMAALGRRHFEDIRAGRPVPWGPRLPWGGSDADS